MILKLVLAIVFWLAMIVLASVLLAHLPDSLISSALCFPVGLIIGFGVVWSVTAILGKEKS